MPTQHEILQNHIEGFLGPETALGNWLLEHIDRDSFYGTSSRDLIYALTAALTPHFKRDMDCADIACATEDALVCLEAEFLAPEFNDMECVLAELTLAAPIRHRHLNSIRRRRFILMRNDCLTRAADPDHVSVIAEIMYLAIAILEDRARRGLSIAQ